MYCFLRNNYICIVYINVNASEYTTKKPKLFNNAETLCVGGAGDRGAGKSELTLLACTYFILLFV